jgi:hypothetical protein
MAKAKQEQAKKGKAKKGAKAKQGKDGETPLPSVARHPRAGAQVARAKAWGGLGGFLLTAVLSWQAGVPIPSLLLRGIAGGIAGYVATWACAVAVWRHLVIAELRAVRAHRLAEARRRAAAAQKPGPSQSSAS